MTTNFFMAVQLETGHPKHTPPALWIGRAEVKQELALDDNEQPYQYDVAVITDLWFLSYAAADISKARRVELPDNTKDGYTFRYRLETAAIAAYHNPKLQPAEMPDDEK
jgi:hypothetical protein